MKKKILAGMVVVVMLMIVGVSGYGIYFVKSPWMTLWQISRAFENRDVNLAKKYFAIEDVANQLADELENAIKTEMEKPLGAANEWEKMGQEFGKNLVLGMLPKLKEEIKTEFEKEFVKSIESPDLEKKAPDRDQLRELDWSDIFFPSSKMKIRAEGALRFIELGNGEERVVFRLRNEEGRWRIVGVENIREIYRDSFEKSLDVSLEKDKSEGKRVGFGDRVNIFSEWYLTVGKPEEYSPKDVFSRADEGRKFVVIEVVYENESGDEGTFDASNFELKDGANYRYKRTYSGREPKLDYGTLPANESVKGFITFEIPKEASPSAVIYNSYSVGTLVIE